MSGGQYASKPAACRYCRDTGFVVIEKQVRGLPVEYGYRCVCAAGHEKAETGIPFAINVDMSLRK